MERDLQRYTCRCPCEGGSDNDELSCQLRLPPVLRLERILIASSTASSEVEGLGLSDPKILEVPLQLREEVDRALSLVLRNLAMRA